MDAARVTTLPPRRSISSISSGSRTRWSRERAAVGSSVAKDDAEPSTCTVEYVIRPIGGAVGSSSVMPSALSASSADSKVTWLDITEPSRISSAVRSETSVTSCPPRTSPSASAVPAGPAPTTAIRRGEVMPPSVSPRRQRGSPPTARRTSGHACDKGSMTAKWSTPGSSR